MAPPLLERPRPTRPSAHPVAASTRRDRPGGPTETTGPTVGVDPRSVATLVDATPASRDRYVDFLRAVSILVVVAWHWIFSITQWTADGSLGMPNPIGDVPGLWLATWVLQIMPVFFFVGGFANLASLEATERRGGSGRDFVVGRLRRLGEPIGVYLAVWAGVELLAHAVVPSYAGVQHWGKVVFVPLWFLGVYTGVVLLAPLTARAHRARPVLAFGVLLAGIAVAEVGRLRFGVEALGLVGSALVWLFAHQLGYLWRDGTLVSGTAARRWAMVGVGLGALVVLTNLGVYPRSMVSVEGEGSNMFPTTACIAALAVFQMGIVLLLRPAAERWLARRRPWTFTVAVNAVAMTVFTWHMTALVGAIGLFQLAGGRLLTEPTAAWWLERPLWLALPGVLLAGLLAVFARFELPRRRAA